MKKRLDILIVIVLVLFISGCEVELQKSPRGVDIKNNPSFSLENIDKEIKFSNDKNFLLETKKEIKTDEDKGGILSGVEIEKEYIDLDLPKESVYGVSISGRYVLFRNNAFARVVLVDSDDVEWLIFGTDLLFLEGSDNFENVCDETCVFDKPIIIKEIRVEGTDSNLFLNEINYKTSKSSEKANVLKEKQYDIKLQRLQNEINSKSLSWTAGETSVSKKYYRDLKKLFIGNELANLRGFQYYKGGVFKLEDD